MSDLQEISFSFNEILFKVIEKGKVRSVLAILPYERIPVKTLAKQYWPEMHMFSSTGKGIVPRICFNTLAQDGSQTIFLIKKGDQIDVNKELVSAGIRRDPRLDESERVNEIESDNGEYVPSKSNQRKRKRVVREDLKYPHLNDRGRGETSIIRHLRPKRVHVDERDGEGRKHHVPATSDTPVASGAPLSSNGTNSAT
jgi:hypothetical protein